MKIKLLAVSVLVLALGINTTEAQNRRGSGEQNQYEKQGRPNDEYSQRGNRDDDNSYGDNRYGDNRRGDRDRDYGSDRMSRDRHDDRFDRYDRHERYNRYDRYDRYNDHRGFYKRYDHRYNF